jgi:hypothetical protein
MVDREDAVDPKRLCQRRHNPVDDPDLQAVELLIELHRPDDVLLGGGLEVERRRGVEQLVDELTHCGAIGSQEVVDLDKHRRGNHEPRRPCRSTLVGRPRAAVRSSLSKGKALARAPGGAVAQVIPKASWRSATKTRSSSPRTAAETSPQVVGDPEEPAVV